MTRVLEIVHIAAKPCHGRFRSKRQLHFRVPPITVKVVHTPVVKRDHIRPQAGLFQRFLFNECHHRASRGILARRIGFGFHRFFYSGCHILNAHQDIQFQIRARQLVLRPLSQKTVLQQVPRRGTQFGKRIGTHMVVGNHQTTARNKGPRTTTVETNRRRLRPVQPRLRQVELVPLLKQCLRRIIQKPHAFVGASH